MYISSCKYIRLLYCQLSLFLIILQSDRLFAPKVIEQDEEPKPRKTELIIRESQPTELPPDVVRGKLSSATKKLNLKKIRIKTRERESIAEQTRSKSKRVRNTYDTLSRSQYNCFGLLSSICSVANSDFFPSDLAF